MRRAFLTFIVIALSTTVWAQDSTFTPEFTAEISIRHRGHDETAKSFENSSSASTLEYLKCGLIEGPRQYSIKIPENHVLAKLTLIAKKNGQETQRRSTTFGKGEKARELAFDNNGRMGPYMKNLGEDEVEIQLVVYRKDADAGYVRVPSEFSTFKVLLNQEKENKLEVKTEEVAVAGELE